MFLGIIILSTRIQSWLVYIHIHTIKTNKINDNNNNILSVIWFLYLFAISYRHNIHLYIRYNTFLFVCRIVVVICKYDKIFNVVVKYRCHHYYNYQQCRGRVVCDSSVHKYNVWTGGWHVSYIHLRRIPTVRWKLRWNFKKLNYILSELTFCFLIFIIAVLMIFLLLRNETLAKMKKFVIVQEADCSIHYLTILTFLKQQQMLIGI